MFVRYRRGTMASDIPTEEILLHQLALVQSIAADLDDLEATGFDPEKVATFRALVAERESAVIKNILQYQDRN
jgi:hypothetical protein